MKNAVTTVNGMNGIMINVTNGIANVMQEKSIHALSQENNNF